MNAQPGERSNGQLLDRGRKSRQRDADGAHGSRSLFIVPTRRGDGLMASIRGRMIELEDPTDDPSGPTSDEILILSIASDLAWYAHRFFRGRGLAADVNITALWQTVDDPPRLADVSFTIDVSGVAETTCEALRSALEERAAARSLSSSPRVRVHSQR